MKKRKEQFQMKEFIEYIMLNVVTKKELKKFERDMENKFVLQRDLEVSEKDRLDREFERRSQSWWAKFNEERKEKGLKEIERFKAE